MIVLYLFNYMHNLQFDCFCCTDLLSCYMENKMFPKYLLKENISNNFVCSVKNTKALNSKL